MSDKKFNFLNNVIYCTITLALLPVGGSNSKNELCKCLEGKPARSYRQITLGSKKYIRFK